MVYLVEMFQRNFNQSFYKDCKFYANKGNEKNGVSLYDQYKIEIQDKFKNNELSLMIATKSFGMGINKKKYKVYGSLWYAGINGSFYQEAGRAGRDGQESHCKLLFTEEP